MAIIKGLRNGSDYDRSAIIKRLTLCALAVFTSIGASNVNAQFTGPVFFGVDSGRVDGGPTFLDQNRGVNAMSYGERVDDPCFLEFESFDPGNRTDRNSRAVEECGSRGVKDNSIARLQLGSAFLATGVNVCLNRAGTEVKGLRLEGRLAACLQGEESVEFARPAQRRCDFKRCYTTRATTETIACDSEQAMSKSEHMRPNCDASVGDLVPVASAGGWQTKSSCPGNDMAIVGLHLSTAAGRGGRSIINGMKALCRTLTPD